MKFTKFIRSLLLFTLAMGLLILGYNFIGAVHPMSWLIWPALFYYSLLTLVVYFISASAMQKDNKTFITRIYSAIGIRMVFSLFPLGIYLWLSQQKNMPFILAYLILYFFFTAFEIYLLVSNLRPDFKNKDA